MKKGGQVGAELGGQSDWEFSGQVGGIIQKLMNPNRPELVLKLYLIDQGNKLIFLTDTLNRIK